MLRWLLIVVLASCDAPAILTATPAPEVGAATRPATRPPTATSRSSPTRDPTGLVRCAASQLQAVAAGARTTDSFAGAVFLANRGSAPCTLRGNPDLVLLARDGSTLDLRRSSVTAGSSPALVVVPIGELRQDPAGLMGMGATAPLRWSNYCADVLPTTFRLTLPDAGGVIDGTFVDLAGGPVTSFGTPRCDDASGPSTLTVYPFQEPR